MPARAPDLGRMVEAVNDQRAALGLPPLPGRLTEEVVGEAAVAAVDEVMQAGGEPARNVLRIAVSYSLGLLAKRAPGRAVEVRIPPFAAIQCVPGPRHTRGTPPNVVETDARTWLGIAAGRLTWTAAVASGKLRASGQRSDISGYLPLLSMGPTATTGH